MTKLIKTFLLTFGWMALIATVLSILGAELGISLYRHRLDTLEPLIAHAPLDHIDPKLNGKPIFVAGPSMAHDILKDNYFPVVLENAFRLKRKVEMYQWKNERSSFYTKVWSEDPEPSGGSSYENPPMPLETQVVESASTTVGTYKLPLLYNFKNADEFYKPVPPVAFYEYKIYGDYLYNGKNPDYPEIGDVRVSFFSIPNPDISVIGQQRDVQIFPLEEGRRKGEAYVRLGTYNLNSMLTELKADFGQPRGMWRCVNLLIAFIGSALLLFNYLGSISKKWLLGSLGLSLAINAAFIGLCLLIQLFLLT